MTTFRMKKRKTWMQYKTWGQLFWMEKEKHEGNRRHGCIIWMEKEKHDGNIRHVLMFWTEKEKHESNRRHEGMFWMQKNKYEYNIRHECYTRHVPKFSTEKEKQIQGILTQVNNLFSTNFLRKKHQAYRISTLKILCQPNNWLKSYGQKDNSLST